MTGSFNKRTQSCAENVARGVHIALAIERRGFDLLAGRERRQIFESEIDADVSQRRLRSLGNLDREVDVPAAARVLRERAIADLHAFGRVAMKPHVVALFTEY